MTTKGPVTIDREALERLAREPAEASADPRRRFHPEERSVPARMRFDETEITEEAAE